MTATEAGVPIKSLIRTIPHHPQPGVMFRDITTLLKDPAGFRLTMRELLRHLEGNPIDKVAAIESRGFIVGAPLAYELGAGFVPLRKQGKLPGERIGQDYALEYGTDRVELHVGAIGAGERVLLVDDLLATGGTAEAGCKLIESAGGSIVECCFVIDLPELGGRRRLEEQGYTVHALVEFAGH